MVALRDVVDVNAQGAARIHRLLAGEPIPVALIEDPEDPAAMVLRDSVEDTGSYMQLVHRRRDGSLAPGFVPTPGPGDEGDDSDGEDDALEPVEATDAVDPRSPFDPMALSRLGRKMLCVVGLAMVAMLVSAWLDLDGLQPADVVIGVVALIALALAAVSVVVADAGRREGIVE